MADETKPNPAAEVKAVLDNDVLGTVTNQKGEEVEITTSSAMPGTEPGHMGGAADVFDPNAAARMASGRGPGLQDSERQQPANWVTDADVAKADIVAAQRAAATALAGIPEGTPDLRPEAAGGNAPKIGK